jgi:N-acetyl-alpha-D-glucosaminyl L-malate synthase BshA
MAPEADRPLKIGIVCNPTIGGSGALATELGIWLAARGHELHFISYDLPFRLREHYNSNVFFHTVTLQHYDLFKYPPYTIALAAKIAEVVRWHKLDLIHVHYAIPHSVSTHLAKQLCSCDVKVVTTLHGTDVTTIGKDPNYQDLTAMAVSKSDAISAVSESLRRDAEDVLNIKDKIEVIYNFVDHQRFNPETACSQFHPKKNEQEKVIVHLSNFRHIKHVDDTVRVFKLIQDEIPARLFLIGDGEGMAKVQETVREHKLEAKVEFLGNQDLVADILPRCDLSILNSEHESFGLAILEAMACGVPAVTSHVGGLPEVIEQGVSGYLCDRKDLKSMAKHALRILEPDHHKRFSEAAQQRSLKLFDIEHIGPQYERLYRRVL